MYVVYYLKCSEFKAGDVMRYKTRFYKQLCSVVPVDTLLLDLKRGERLIILTFEYLINNYIALSY